MNPLLNAKNCFLLGLPEPCKQETQREYIRRILLAGHSINTRQCRFIGIGNLHSVVSALRKRRFPLRVEHKPAIEPPSGELLPQLVDHVSADFAEVARIENAPSEPEA